MSSNRSLVDLARHDAKLLQYRRQIAALPQRIEELEKDKKRVQRSIREIEAVFEKVQKSTRKIELEIEELQAKHARSKSRQSSLTSTGAYQALLREMEQQDNRIAQLDEQLLESMERAEQAEKKRDQGKARYEEEIRRIDVLQQQLQADLEKARTDIQEQESKRNEAVECIDPQVRSLYERTLKGKGDVAISLVEEDVCGACNMRQTPQVVQLLRQAKGIQTCQACGRILVMDVDSSLL